jgi:hypothetical protein
MANIKNIKYRWIFFFEFKQASLKDMIKSLYLLIKFNTGFKVFLIYF